MATRSDELIPMDSFENSSTCLKDILSAARAHIRDAPPPRSILYRQNNWIYGNNTKLTIINGPNSQKASTGLIGAIIDTPDSCDITSEWRRIPGDRIVYEQKNRVYGANRRLKILNGPAPTMLGFPDDPNEYSYEYEQNNWVYGDNERLRIFNGPESSTPAKNVQNNWVYGSSGDMVVVCGSTNGCTHSAHGVTQQGGGKLNICGVST